jgi:hypothetical protein
MTLEALLFIGAKPQEQSCKSKAARFKSITAMDRFNENFMNAHGGGGE